MSACADEFLYRALPSFPFPLSVLFHVIMKKESFKIFRKGNGGRDMKFEYYGHAAFVLDTGKERLLFDPFLSGNASAAIRAEDVRCDYILLSHAHSDHFGDADAIAARTGATVIAIPEVLGLFEKSPSASPMNIGGTAVFPFGRVTMTPAFHSSGVAGGMACGFLLRFTGGPVVYYSGDTGIFGDMALIGKKAPIDYAILPIGDNYTMGSEDAVAAAKLLGAHSVIPIHYNTWPVIAQDPEKLAALAEEIGVNPCIVRVGASLTLV